MFSFQQTRGIGCRTAPMHGGSVTAVRTESSAHRGCGGTRSKPIPPIGAALESSRRYAAHLVVLPVIRDDRSGVTGTAEDRAVIDDRRLSIGLDNQALVVTNERERFFAGATATAPWLPSSASGTLVTSRISGRRNVPDAPRRPHRGAADLAAGRGTEVEGGVPRQEEHQGRPRRARQRREARCQQCLGRRSRRAGEYHPARRPPHVQSARDRRLVHDEAREDRLRAVHYSGCWPAHRTGGVSRRVAATMAHGNQIL
jgi:hypothetical protein